MPENKNKNQQPLFAKLSKARISDKISKIN
jgi:hypothetical protein